MRELKEVTLSNPRIVSDSSMKAGQKVTWDCIWFGSYPQSEVIPASEEYTALSESFIQTGDLIKDDGLYQTLQSATGWDGQGDIAIDGEKYRRIKKEAATSSSQNYNKVFLLSESEVYTDTAKKYGFVSDDNTSDEARRAKSSVFAKAMDLK